MPYWLLIQDGHKEKWPFKAIFHPHVHAQSSECISLNILSGQEVEFRVQGQPWYSTPGVVGDQEIHSRAQKQQLGGIAWI